MIGYFHFFFQDIRALHHTVVLFHSFRQLIQLVFHERSCFLLLTMIVNHADNECHTCTDAGRNNSFHIPSFPQHLRRHKICTKIRPLRSCSDFHVNSPNLYLCNKKTSIPTRLIFFDSQITYHYHQYTFLCIS